MEIKNKDQVAIDDFDSGREDDDDREDVHSEDDDDRENVHSEDE